METQATDPACRSYPAFAGVLRREWTDRRCSAYSLT